MASGAALIQHYPFVSSHSFLLGCQAITQVKFPSEVSKTVLLPLLSLNMVGVWFNFHFFGADFSCSLSTVLLKVGDWCCNRGQTQLFHNPVTPHILFHFLSHGPNLWGGKTHPGALRGGLKTAILEWMKWHFDIVCQKLKSH